jgi:hypothetical protein
VGATARIPAGREPAAAGDRGMATLSLSALSGLPAQPVGSRGPEDGAREQTAPPVAGLLA